MKTFLLKSNTHTRPQSDPDTGPPGIIETEMTNTPYTFQKS